MKKEYKNDKCYLCGATEYQMIHEGTRGIKNIDVLKCNNCGLVRLSEFINNPDDFYRNSNMRKIEQSLEEIRNAAEEDDERRFRFCKNMIKNKTILDFGCGAGGFLCRAKNVALNVFGVEIEAKMNTALNREGILCYSSIEEAERDMQQKVDLVTMFHVLEHLEEPEEFLHRLKNMLTSNGKIIIEVPNAEDALLTLYDCKDFAEFTYWECHFYLYTVETLKLLAQKIGMKAKFVQQIQRDPLSNHLYWLTNRKPGGHVQWAALNDSCLDKQYGDKLAQLGIADTILAIFE